MWTDECGLWLGGEEGEESREQPQGVWNFTESKTKTSTESRGRHENKINLCSFCADVSRWLSQLYVKVMDGEFWDYGSCHSMGIEGWQWNYSERPWLSMTKGVQICVCVCDRSLNRIHLPTPWAILRLYGIYFPGSQLCIYVCVLILTTAI